MKTDISFRSTIAHSLLLAAVMVLSGCQATMSRVGDCKAGDWVDIGRKDGAEGLDRNFDERRRFCSFIDGDKIGEQSAADYSNGWGQGNQQYWNRLGREDGRNGQALAHFEQRANSATTQKNRTPLHRDAYEQGWQLGNADYWQQSGHQDGLAGLNAGQEASRASAGARIGFNAASYRQGWRDGNYAYWRQLGFQDAHDGIPDSELQQRARTAKDSGLQVREDAYREGWNREIVEYWKNLGWQDATEGRDIHTRRDDAKKRGLKIFETEYRQQWEKRLIQYWQDAGNSDGYGHPDRLEERMANARRDKVFVIAQTRDLYQQAWSRQNASYCSLDNAFAWGRQNHSMAISVCSAALQNRLQRAWHSGQDYEEVARKHRHVLTDLAVLGERYADAGRRLERLEREIRRDQDDKNRANTTENANTDRRRERERHELRDVLQDLGRRLEDLRHWEFRYSRQLQQLQRDIYLD